MNPIITSNAIIDTYFRYIMTRFPLGKSDPEIRKQFKNLLYSSQGKSRIIKGPILEITPPYKKGYSLMELSKKIPIWQPLVNHFTKTGNYPVERPLFLHQEKALIESLDNNIIVSTGTGSGKTECFLFPILRFCLKNPGEGVRAILVYPLNALVEDQIRRLGQYLKDTNITFGKYTGQTPKTLKEADNKSKLCSNHLICRKEMRSKPPNILITNYAMLEYMLLRPGDSPIIDKGDENSFKFIVLDEAHTYSGAQGTEVAYLLKRLMHRVKRNASDIRCIATSATLGSGKDASDKTVTFAKRLFGAVFSRNYIIRGEKQLPSEYLPDETLINNKLDKIIEWGLCRPHLSQKKRF